MASGSEGVRLPKRRRLTVIFKSDDQFRWQNWRWLRGEGLGVEDSPLERPGGEQESY